MSRFVFEQYHYDETTNTATFSYSFDDDRSFTETITFEQTGQVDGELLDRALFLAFVLIGTSYYKTFPTSDVSLADRAIDEWQAAFFSSVYQEGLSQFAFENQLRRADLAQFQATGAGSAPLAYTETGTLVLESGGKDSLLTATMLAEKGESFTSWYLATGERYPSVLDDLGQAVAIARRSIDRDGLITAQADGGRNGHVPITYIVQSIALIQAILLGKHRVVVSIAHEGEEPHAMIDDLPVTHQWSKTWQAEEQFAEYVRRYISPDIQIGSPLRRFSELKVAELFTQKAWTKFGHRFSSCNVANYKQGVDNSQLHWCGECPKCANSYLLFAPFVAADELKSLFAGQDLFEKPMLQETFKGLLGVDGVMKPFECVGEIDELRFAYHQAQVKGGYGTVSFDVPPTAFDYQVEYPSQDWSHLF